MTSKQIEILIVNKLREERDYLVKVREWDDDEVDRCGGCSDYYDESQRSRGKIMGLRRTS